ncbi:AraC family transcriptional regulator [Lentisphaera profundi]|uniref:AraC family transcriptional regulator n=1 Tax=Lentisphaera profundi TaxID=1658616 RepID=A0ABY7VVL8_9BACT|nr:AraC family transcriptional regulator [Lentisphaera profundi]WDE97255.1 AraC family transcriptional regulator [Lentisphaera profundi]
MNKDLAYLKSFYKENNCPLPSNLLTEQIDSFYFAKDTKGIFVCVDNTLLKHFHMNNSSDILGKSDFDIQRQDLAEKHRIDDLNILSSGLSVPSKIELVGDGQGNVKWFQTTKAPLRNNTGEIVGIEGLSRDIKMTKESIEPYNEFKNTVSFLQKNFKKSLNIQDIAYQSAMSVSTFERKFKKYFGCSPTQFIKKLRIDHACELLDLNYDLSDIALECGFCDQSYFTKEFKRVMNMTPRQFKLKNTKNHK